MGKIEYCRECEEILEEYRIVPNTKFCNNKQCYRYGILVVRNIRRK